MDDVDAEQYLIWLEKKENEQKEKTITEEQRLAENQIKVMAEYQKMIINFNQLNAKKSTAPIYFEIKEHLKEVLLSGKPPGIIPELEKIRSILMSKE